MKWLHNSQKFMTFKKDSKFLNPNSEKSLEFHGEYVCFSVSRF